MVTGRTIDRLCTGLKGVRLLLVLSIPAAVLWLWPFGSLVESTDSAVNSVNMAHPDESHQVSTTKPLSWYAPLWERDLRQSPIPSTIEPKKQPIKPTGPLPTLVATFVQPPNRFAHLKDSHGRITMMGVDEVVDQYQLVAIEPGRVQLSLGGDRVWIELPPKQAP